MSATTQIRIVHLSDIHFHETAGDSVHRFASPRTAAGGPMANPGLVDLLHSLRDDWQSVDWAPEQQGELRGPEEREHVVLALTGDLTQTAAPSEFNLLDAFVRGLRDGQVFGSSLDAKDIFVVPGNHDVIYVQPDTSARWQPYCTFYQRLRGQLCDPGDPGALTRVIDRSDIGLVVAELNSCAYVQQNTPDAQRGQIDDQALAVLRGQLEQIDASVRQNCVRIALVHHHPIVLPQLVEPGRGYDAIVNSEKLIAILQRYGFHAIMHGHKHNPHTFSTDAAPAWSAESVQPIMVIAGGSASSTELPDKWRSSTNTYNVTTIKWHPRSGQARVRVVTRGLVRHHPDGRPFDFTTEWKWRTLRVEDRRLIQNETLPPVRGTNTIAYELCDQVISSEQREKRRGWYHELRGNMPTIETMPSLVAGQAYEVRMWIVGHDGRAPENIPREVIWSAGRSFPIWICRAEDDPNFCAFYHYWGAVAIQALLRFHDGTEAVAHVYARIPDVAVEGGGGRHLPALPVAAVSGRERVELLLGDDD